MTQNYFNQIIKQPIKDLVTKLVSSPEDLYVVEVVPVASIPVNPIGDEGISVPPYKKEKKIFASLAERNDFLKQYKVGSKVPVDCKLPLFAGSTKAYPVMTSSSSDSYVKIGLSVLPKNDAHNYFWND